MTNNRSTATELLRAQKKKLREQAYAARAAQGEKDRISDLICRIFTELPAFRNSHTVMVYLGCRSEVRTGAAVNHLLAGEKQLVIPFCTVDTQGNNKLGLWRLESLDELVSGCWNILEPPKSRWDEPGKRVEAEQLDLIMVPGVAFDAQGGRIGNGQGYYDRLLNEVRPDCALAGVGFECQIFDRVPMGDHDIFLDQVITEKNVFSGIGRNSRPAS